MMNDKSESDSDTDYVPLFKKSSAKTRNSNSSLKRKRVEKKGAGSKLNVQLRHRGEELVVGNFELLGLSPWLQISCESLNITKPTPIQAACIPETLKGKNILGQAQTGSGKTAAFALPILENLAKDPYGIYAVVLTPTRELAFQITEQFLALGSPIRVKCETVVGGMEMLQQSIALKARPHVVVATPGRLAWILRGPDPPYLSAAKYLVLDEADRLLSGSFSNELRVVMNAIPRDTRQTLLYSATISNSIEKIRSLNNKNDSRQLFEYYATPSSTTVDTLDEKYCLVPDQVKHAYLGQLLRVVGPEFKHSGLAKRAVGRKRKRRQLKDVVHVDDEEEEEKQGVHSAETNDEVGNVGLLINGRRAESIIIFVSTKKSCFLLSETLLELGIECVALSSDLSQNRRLAALAKFRSSMVKILVATDVASRGLDIPEVDLVINYDVPRDPDDYVHRAGRTARAGRKGRVVTFVTQYDVKLVLAIEKLTGKKMEALDDLKQEDALLLLTRVTNAMQAARMKIKQYRRREKSKALD